MPIRYSLVGLALLWAASAPAAWQQASSKHFVVYIDDTADNALAFTTRLERSDKAMRVLRGIEDRPTSANARVTVFVVRDSMMARLSQSAMVAGFYIPRASGSVAFVPAKGEGNRKGDLSREAVLLHEYAHHFMYASLAGAVIPPWLSEGFAEFHATTEILPNGDAVVGKPPLYRAFGIIEGKDMAISTLLSATPSAMGMDNMQMFYGRGWLMTHYLSTDASRRARLTNYLQAIAAGTPPREAALILGEPKALNKAIGTYLRSLPTFTIPAATLTIAPVAVRPLRAGESAVMASFIQSRCGVNSRTAGTVASSAITEAAPFSSDAVAQEELAQAELDADRPSEALAAADRAVAADPASVRAMMFDGLARVALARRSATPDAKAFAAARAWFSRANHADPEYAWPLEEYYRSFGAAKETPTHNAEDGLLYAHELASFDPQLAMMAGYVELTRDKADRAMRALRPVAYDPHGGTRGKAVTEVLARIGVDTNAVVAARLKSLVEKEGEAKGRS